VVWCGVVWCDVVRCGAVRCGAVCGVEWSGVEWSGVEWSGVVWCGVVVESWVLGLVQSLKYALALLPSACCYSAGITPPSLRVLHCM